MPMTPGYYMPTNYQNYYPSQASMYTPTQQSYAQQPQQNAAQSIQWVDGEVGAKAYQIPQGWPANTPIPLWDTNDTIIYLKSINQMGMPNPLQKIHYTMEEQQTQAAITSGMSGAPQPAFATKEDLNAMVAELKEMIKNVQTTQSFISQNGSNNGKGR